MNGSASWEQLRGDERYRPIGGSMVVNRSVAVIGVQNAVSSWTDANFGT
jgi:hypothetical protein